MKRVLPCILLVAVFAAGVLSAAAAEPDETPLPGLWQIKNGDWSTLRRELGPVMGTVKDSYTSPIDGVVSKWAEFDSWSYEGEIFMEAGKTYTFGACIDNYCDIFIDDGKVLSQGWPDFGTSSYVCTSTGWHSVSISIWDTGGGFGFMTEWPIGIAWNTTGLTSQEPISGWTQLVDPGDGSLFRVVGKPKRAVVVENVVATQRYPWNGMVDIDYEVVCDDPEADVWVYATGMDNDLNVSMAPRALSGDGAVGPVKAGKHRMTWNVTADYPGFAAQSFTVKMCALVGGAPYMVVDLSGGVDALSYPVSYLNSVPEGGWGDEYKTDKLVLRLVPPGTFLMGSPSDERGRESSSSYKETRHQVTLSKPFYIGVFELTQKQWFNVMGTSKPSSSGNYKKIGDRYPAHDVSYNEIRGTVNGAAWPTHNQVDANSFMGRLRSKANMVFDLPTEAQWEYACRAGTGSALNSGKEITATGSNRCKNLDQVAWYYMWGGSSRGYPDIVAGPDNWRLPNVWGLYDMHGNVLEWCLDWHIQDLGTSAKTDPKGAASSSASYAGWGYRVLRGGGYLGVGWGNPQYCRSAARMGSYPTNGSSNSDYFGFRVACLPAD